MSERNLSLIWLMHFGLATSARFQVTRTFVIREVIKCLRVFVFYNIPIDSGGSTGMDRFGSDGVV